MPKKGYKPTKEHRENLSESHKGKPRGGNPENWKHSDKTKEKLRQKALKQFVNGMPIKTRNKIKRNAKINPNFGMRGKKQTEKAKKLVSKNNGRYWKDKKRPPFSKKWKENISKSKKGNKRSEKSRMKQSKTILRLYTEGKKMGFQKIEGIERIYPIDWTDNIRKAIRMRDEYICQICGIHQDELESRFRKLDIHHIDYDKDNLNPDNLVALCRNCHIKTNFNRKYWINYFNNKQ